MFEQYDSFEEGKWSAAFYSALIITVFFLAIFLSGRIDFSSSQPQAIQISFIPNTPKPLPKKKPQVEKKKEVVPKEPPPKDDAAKIVRDKKKKKKKKKIEEKPKEKVKPKKEKEKTEEKKEEKKVEEEKPEEKNEIKEEVETVVEVPTVTVDPLAEKRKQARLQERLQGISNDIGNRIIERINDYLKTPLSVPRDGTIMVKIKVYLDSNGNLLDIPQVIEKSGYDEFDESAVRAVMQAEPLPMPVQKFILENSELMKNFIEHNLEVFAY